MDTIYLRKVIPAAVCPSSVEIGVDAGDRASVFDEGSAVVGATALAKAEADAGGVWGTAGAGTGLADTRGTPESDGFFFIKATTPIAANRHTEPIRIKRAADKVPLLIAKEPTLNYQQIGIFFKP